MLILGKLGLVSVVEEGEVPQESSKTYREKLERLLTENLDFHNSNGNYGPHNFHSFPAKFPPQLPSRFIHELTSPGDIVVDPMAGSGTTVIEAALNGRYGIGFDIDPLAVMMSGAKTSRLDIEQVRKTSERISKEAREVLIDRRPELEKELQGRWNGKTKEFVDYWFTEDTQLELLALISEIEKEKDPLIKAFFEVCFSSVIITKSGGVSLAFDLGHTRPHKAKVVVDRYGKVLLGKELMESDGGSRLMIKIVRSAVEEFEKRIRNNLKSLEYVPEGSRAETICGNSQSLSLKPCSVDLIVTSPPYASNAIDYMRAHKFSLVWMGRTIEDLERKRKKYIGGELTSSFEFEKLPEHVNEVVSAIASSDKKKGEVLRRYYSEMTRSLREMFRVLKADRVAIVVVGSSVMRNKSTETDACLVSIGRSVGFEIAGTGIRYLDRNRRMLPAGMKLDLTSQIQQRMHAEFVIGLYKPQ